MVETGKVPPLEQALRLDCSPPLSSCNLTQGPLASLALELHELLPRHPKASTQALSCRTQLLVSKDKQEKKRAEQAEQAAKPLLFCRHSS